MYLIILEKNIKTPLYEQIEIELKRLINDDKYKQGALIASESELGREFGASRITIRRAISDLVDQGYLVKKQGKGTFVQANMVERNLLHLGSYSNFMKNSSKHPSVQIVKLQEIASTDKIAELPILKQFNKTGGIIYGLLRGVLIIYVLLMLIGVFGQVNPNNSVHMQIEDSYLGKLMYDNNILNIFFS